MPSWTGCLENERFRTNIIYDSGRCSVMKATYPVET